MPVLTRTVTTSAAPSEVFAYLADFENAAEWDSGTVSCERTSGDGGPGTTYRNHSRFAGRDVVLTYTVDLCEEPTLLITGRTPTTTSADTIVVSPAEGGGSQVRYVAEFTFTGPARLLGPVMGLLLRRLGDETARTLTAALRRLPSA